MKDPTNEIVSALFDALDGNVSYGGSTIPVYTRIIEWGDRTVDQMIQIADVALEEDGPKDAYITEGTVDVYVDTFFKGKNAGSWVQANAISSSVTQLIDTTFTLTGYTQIMGRVSGIISPDYTLDDGGVVMRKLITYSFIIQEN